MKNNLLVSVIVPVYNTGKKVAKLLEEILDNGYDNIEVILIDDGSDDDSLETLQKVRSDKVKVYHKENGGPSSARNFGINKARGDYLVFIDSDDSIKKGFIKKLVDKMQEEDTALAMTGVEYHYVSGKSAEKMYLQPFTREVGESLEKYVLRSMLKDGRMYPAFNKIFDAEVMKKNNLRFDEDINYGEDTKFVLDYLKTKNGEIKFILEPLYIYNVGTETSTAAKAVGVWGNWQKCYSNLKRWAGKNVGVEERLLLKLIYLKWRASWLKARIF